MPRVIPPSFPPRPMEQVPPLRQNPFEIPQISNPIPLIPPILPPLRRIPYNINMPHLPNNNHSIPHINNRIDELLEEVEITENILEKLKMKECSICLEEYSIGEKICYLPCFHDFHSECIKKWTKKSNKCPLCNNEIKFE